MKISKKLKWGLTLLGVGMVAAIPMGIALSSCSSSDDNNNDNNNNNQNNGGNNNGFVVDENGIIQPLTKNDITPTTYNFDNRLTSNTAEIKQVSSLEEANKILNDQWNSLSDKQKLECIKNDIQNWFNQSWYNVDFLSSSDYFLPNNGTIDNQLLNSNPVMWGGPNNDNDPNFRNMSICNVNNINTKNNLFNLNYNYSLVRQNKLPNSATVDAQSKYVYNYIYENITINPIVLNVNNKYVSGLVFSTNANSSMNVKMESVQNCIINESIEGFTSSDIANVKNMIGEKFPPEPLENNWYSNIISPYLNMIFEINNN